MSNEKIILRAVHKQKRSTMEIGPTWDSRKNQWAGGVKAVDNNGQPILSREEKDSGDYFVKCTDRFVIADKTTYDLNNPVDKKIWEAISPSKMIAKDGYGTKDLRGNSLIDGNNDAMPKTRRYGMAIFYVERPDLETEISNTAKKLAFDAKSLVYGDSPEGWLKICKILGRQMFNTKQGDVEAYLIGLSDKAPEKVINAYKSPDSVDRLLLFDATDKNIITKDGSIYRHEGDIIGTSEMATLNFIKDTKNKRLVDQIRKETYPEWFTKSKKVADKK